MDLVQVDVIHLELAQRVVAGLNDVFAAEATAIWAWSHGAAYLGRDDNVIARRHLAEPASGYLFAATDRVNVGCIEEIDAGFEGNRKMLARFFGAKRPVPVHRPRRL